MKKLWILALILGLLVGQLPTSDSYNTPTRVVWEILDVSPQAQLIMMVLTHFTVRLSSGQLLCFSVRGEVGSNFNLISTDELEMNALFTKVADHPGTHKTITGLGAIGIFVAGKELVFNSVTSTISIENKVNVSPSAIQRISIEDDQLLLAMTNGIRTREVEVDVRALKLKFTVVFQHDHLDMIWSSEGLDTRHIHGLVGQFLHPSVKIDEKEKLLILPGQPAIPVEKKRLFAFVRRESTRYKEKKCWTVVEHHNPGAGIIEDIYSNYEVNSILSTGLRFGVANATNSSS